MTYYKKVLVVDDNEVDRYMTGRCIEKYGFAEEWVLKESAGKALVYLMSLESHHDELPEVIFLAVSLIERDGFVFIEHYQKLPEVIKSKCRIVILTAPFSSNDHGQSRNNKYVSMFLNKPLDKEKLQEIASEIPTRVSRKQSHAA